MYVPVYFKTERYISDITKVIDGINGKDYVLMTNVDNKYAHVRSRYYIDVGVKVPNDETGILEIRMHREGVLKQDIKFITMNHHVSCTKKMYREMRDVLFSVRHPSVVTAMNVYLNNALKSESLSFFGIHLQYIQGELIRVLNRCKYLEKNLSERKLKDKIGTEITMNYNTCDIVYSRGLYPVLKLLQSDITNTMFNNSKSLTDFDELKEFQKQVQSLYEDSLRPVLIEFQKYLLEKNTDDRWHELMQGSKLKGENLRGWLRYMKDNLKAFIHKFEINKTHFLHEITDRNKNRISLAFSLYRQLKKRERAITQLTLPFTVMLNDELKHQLLYLFTLYPSFQRSDENTYGNWITFQDLMETYNNLKEKERERKKINKTIVLDVDIFNRTMERLWKQTPTHLKQFKELENIVEQRYRKSTFTPIKSSRKLKSVNKDPIKYTTTYDSITAIPNVYLD